MARTRYIKPELFTDTTLGRLSVSARFLYIGLWTLMDKRAICEADPLLINHAVFPYDKFELSQVEVWLDELVNSGRLVRFEASGKLWFRCPTLWAHQKFHRDEKPKYLKHLDDASLDRSISVLSSTNADANSTRTRTRTRTETETLTRTQTGTRTENGELEREETNAIDPKIYELNEKLKREQAKHLPKAWNKP